MLGLKRGIVELCPHEKEWEATADKTIRFLKDTFGNKAADIQHVGSTSIRTICAKPIIDIAVLARDFDWFIRQKDVLMEYGLNYRGEDVANEILYVMGQDNIRTHHIHVCRPGSAEWADYIRFRDYLNANPLAAREYEGLKKRLSQEYKYNREAYTLGKETLIKKLLTEAKEWEKQ